MLIEKWKTREHKSETDMKVMFISSGEYLPACVTECQECQVKTDLLFSDRTRSNNILFSDSRFSSPLHRLSTLICNADLKDDWRTKLCWLTQWVAERFITRERYLRIYAAEAGGKRSNTCINKHKWLSPQTLQSFFFCLRSQVGVVFRLICMLRSKRAKKKKKNNTNPAACKNI